MALVLSVRRAVHHDLIPDLTSATSFLFSSAVLAVFPQPFPIPHVLSLLSASPHFCGETHIMFNTAEPPDHRIHPSIDRQKRICTLTLKQLLSCKSRTCMGSCIVCHKDKRQQLVPVIFFPWTFKALKIALIVLSLRSTILLLHGAYAVVYVLYLLYTLLNSKQS